MTLHPAWLQHELCEVRAGFIPQSGTCSAQSVDISGDGRPKPFALLLSRPRVLHVKCISFCNFAPTEPQTIFHTNQDRVSSPSLQEFSFLFDLGFF